MMNDKSEMAMFSSGYKQLSFFTSLKHCKCIFFFFSLHIYHMGAEGLCILVPKEPRLLKYLEYWKLSCQKEEKSGRFHISN